jgi:hypothetical protein
MELKELRIGYAAWRLRGEVTALPIVATHLYYRGEPGDETRPRGTF